MTRHKSFAFISIVATFIFPLPGIASQEPETLRELTEKVVQLEDKAGADSYLKEYYDDLPSQNAKLSMECPRLAEEALKPRLVFVGDKHGDLEPIELVQSIARGHLRRGFKPTLVIEFVFARYQAHVNSYLSGRMTLAQLRTHIEFDDFGWSWKWEQVSRLLVLARKHGLRVIAAEQGSNNMAMRDSFTAKLLVRDLFANPDDKYIVMYGTHHLLGRGHLPDLLERRGFVSQLKIVNFLGRETEAALTAAGDEKANCLRLRPNLIFSSRLSALGELREYYQELRDGPQEPREPEAALKL
jgi:uncharacterized iron-regulated protein